MGITSRPLQSEQHQHAVRHSRNTTTFHFRAFLVTCPDASPTFILHDAFDFSASRVSLHPIHVTFHDKSRPAFRPNPTPTCFHNSITPRPSLCGSHDSPRSQQPKVNDWHGNPLLTLSRSRRALLDLLPRRDFFVPTTQALHSAAPHPITIGQCWFQDVSSLTQLRSTLNLFKLPQPSHSSG